MKRIELKDYFFDKQPKQTFSEDLKTYEIPKINFCDIPYKNGVSIKNISLDVGSFENNTYLQTVFEDFNDFTKANNMEGNGYVVHLKEKEGLEKEEYCIDIQKDTCNIYAGEIEGIRRAVMRLEDLLLIGGGNLKIGTIHNKSIVKTRISRSFFSPTTRAPFYGDELSDEIDYYPDGYLRRLMHDGINALWITSAFSDLIRSSYITEFGEGNEKRIEKLNKVIDRCARYGIQIYIFMIEPRNLFNPLLTRKYHDLSNKYPQVLGNSFYATKAFCTYTDFGEKYLAEAVEQLFTNVPKLAGIIDITLGERVTSCGTNFADVMAEHHNDCPRCKDKSRAEIVAHTIDIMVRAMKKVKPNAEFISWTYGMCQESEETLDEYMEKVPDTAISMLNFEDGGHVEQLGKKRFPRDYYLSFAGPSQMFSEASDKAKKFKKELYAKMQICCSHDLASMQYIPVPGIIYDKITRAKEIGVTGVMTGWYMGNYPCFMIRAVTMLSGTYTYQSKREFLTDLAGIYYSQKDVEKVVNAWECFEQGYIHSPINVMFTYYGPMSDSVCWELSLLPKNFSLPRTWSLEDKHDGDRIGECLYSGHTIEEVVTLCEQIKNNWRLAVKFFDGVVCNEGDTQYEAMQVLSLLADSGYNIMKFYKLRNDLGYKKGNCVEILEQLRNIVYEEIENSKQIIPLCEKDNTFGFHSEAVGYKFFPAKIEHRIESLKKLLKEEFPVVEENIKKGASPLPYYDGEEEGTKHYKAGRNGLENASWEFLTDKVSKFKVAEQGEYLELEFYSKKVTNFIVCNEFELMFPQSAYIFKNDGQIKLAIQSMTHQSVLEEKKEEYLKRWSCQKVDDAPTHLIIRGKKSEVGFYKYPYKLNVMLQDESKWCEDIHLNRDLGKGFTTPPGDFGWID